MTLEHRDPQHMLSTTALSHPCHDRADLAQTNPADQEQPSATALSRGLLSLILCAIPCATLAAGLLVAMDQPIPLIAAGYVTAGTLATLIAAAINARL